jgi:hypothetical protein
MTPIPLFVELCAGTAALSLRLHRDGARPPVSRMGAKTGYADTILRVLGIVPGQRAERYLWCEPDAGVRLLLAAYADGALAKVAADIIRGWAGEDPRALWERLRAEGPVRDEGAGEVARSVLLGEWAFRRGEPDSGPAGPGRWNDTPWRDATGKAVATRVGTTADAVARRLDTIHTLPAAITPDARAVDPREVARWARIVSSNRLVNLDPMTWQNTGVGGSTFGGADFCTPAPDLAANFGTVPTLPALTLPDARAVDPREAARWMFLAQSSVRRGDPASGYDDEPARWERGTRGKPRHPALVIADRSDLPTLPAAITPDARAVDPREVARWALLGAWSFKAGRPESGFRDPMGGLSGGAHGKDGGCDGLTIGGASDRFDTLPTLPALTLPDARAVDPGPDLPPGTVAYMDPSYVGTTGYADNLGRPEVVALARRWADAGATVCISEAEPIPELVAEGWHAVRIDGERVGQKRTFSRQQAEYLTINRAPAWVPSVQRGLFA